MARKSLATTTARILTAGALPLAAAALFAGSANAAATADTVSGGIPLEVATNPDAQYPDPVLNGAVTGAAIGSATGSFTDPVPTVLGALIGGIVGAVDPVVVPQVLP
ncbi:glycine zipper domain-containing protein [Nocardia aurantia]|uniref:Glycine zipper domain-containing protein n=1 Tax=Nocardia aurantia TaxID=2585199 RepID=A0A7K0DI78_9NOCA|nr:glycine zipper domain-containing protein [Nocardia aurantia]MQY25291.1 hypothetical protein [Nocardia aurantia]